MFLDVNFRTSIHFKIVLVVLLLRPFATLAQKKTYFNNKKSGSDYRNYKTNLVVKDSILLNPNDTILYTKVPLTKAQPESTLGNWICDALRTEVSSVKKMHIDICMISYMSIGIDFIAPGAIQRKNLLEIIPYNNQLKLIRISGKTLKIVCDGIAASKGMPISGMRIDIEKNEVKNIQVNGQEINQFLIYNLLVNDYLLKDRHFGEILSTQNTVPLWLDMRKALENAAIKSLKQGVYINPSLDERIKYLD